jgi:hypothetical protein
MPETMMETMRAEMSSVPTCRMATAVPSASMATAPVTTRNSETGDCQQQGSSQHRCPVAKKAFHGDASTHLGRMRAGSVSPTVIPPQ